MNFNFQIKCTVRSLEQCLLVYLDRYLCKCVHILNNINGCLSKETEINDQNGINKLDFV